MRLTQPKVTHLYQYAFSYSMLYAGSWQTEVKVTIQSIADKVQHHFWIRLGLLTGKPESWIMTKVYSYGAFSAFWVSDFPSALCWDLTSQFPSSVVYFFSSLSLNCAFYFHYSPLTGLGLMSVVKYRLWSCVILESPVCVFRSRVALVLLLLLLRLDGPLMTFPDIHLPQPLLEIWFLGSGRGSSRMISHHAPFQLWQSAPCLSGRDFRELQARERILVSLWDNSTSVRSRLSGYTATSDLYLSADTSWTSRVSSGRNPAAQTPFCFYSK